MIRGRLLTTRALTRSIPTTRTFTSISTPTPVTSNSPTHKVLVIGGGTAGLTISHQLLRSGTFTQDDIAVVDPSTTHDYQPGWTLVGGGLKRKQQFRKPLTNLLNPKLKFYNTAVSSFSPDTNTVRLVNGDSITYEQLVVAPGIEIKYDSIQGLPEALADPESPVSSIYGYETCDKVFRTIQNLKTGTAVFTQPTGVVKCAGAPQKVMWMAWDFWRRAGLHTGSSDSPISINFATGLPSMFGVPKYSATLERLRQERGVNGFFTHDLTSINGNTATFAQPDGKTMDMHFDLLHVVPKMGAHSFVKESALANDAGFVDVDPGTTRHVKYDNVWSAGDAASLPTSKTAAAITAQAPVLVRNLLRAMEGKEIQNVYDGYTSCPLVTEYGKVLLAEFKYGGESKETFGKWLGIDQATPRRAFYHLKKDFFPWVYYQSMVKGTWGGPDGWMK